ncbi:MAG: GH25 family lysozyme [Coprobacillus sp.]
MTKTFGLDLSKHNGKVNFENIKKAGHDFVILRAGYGSSTIDPLFETYYQQARQAGLQIGTYWYSYALNVEQAKQEAIKCLEVIKGKTFEYPIYIDMEDADDYKAYNGMPTKAMLVNICNTFCKMIEEQKYYTGVYASESWFDNQLKGLAIGQYDKWVANWGTNNGTLQDDKSHSYRLHQFTSEYSLDKKRYDRNVCYYNYPEIIKGNGLNGFSKKPIIPKPDTPKPLFQVGDKVRIKLGAKDLNTKTTFSNFVYQTVYVVTAYTDQRLVFGKSLNAITGVILPSDAIKANTMLYYPKVSFVELSFVDALKKINVDSSLENRKRIAAQNGIVNYSGKASENIKLLNLLKKGLLIKI